MTDSAEVELWSVFFFTGIYRSENYLSLSLFLSLSLSLSISLHFQKGFEEGVYSALSWLKMFELFDRRVRLRSQWED